MGHHLLNSGELTLIRTYRGSVHARRKAPRIAYTMIRYSHKSATNAHDLDIHASQTIQRMSHRLVMPQVSHFISIPYLLLFLFSVLCIKVRFNFHSISINLIFLVYIHLHHLSDRSRSWSMVYSIHKSAVED